MAREKMLLKLKVNGQAREIRVHPFRILRNGQVVNISEHSLESLLGRRRHGNVLADLIGASRAKTGQAGHELPDLRRTLGKRIASRNTELKRQGQTGPCYDCAFQEISSVHIF